MIGSYKSDFAVGDSFHAQNVPPLAAGRSSYPKSKVL